MEETSNPFSVVVLEVEMHCENCASKIADSAGRLKGVENVRVDIDLNHLTVIGKVDPSQIQEELSRKTKKMFDIVSSGPEKGDSVTISEKNKDEKKSIEKNPDVDKKQALETTTVLVKLGHYCKGCWPKIQKIVQDTNGVQEMTLAKDKEMITVKGTMDAKLLLENLEKLNRPVEILSLKKEKYNNGSDQDSKNGNEDGKNKMGSAQEDGCHDTDMELELKPEKAPAIVAVFKMPLHCKGCIKKIHKIISRIRGVQDVKINEEEETVTVKTTIDVNALAETMKKRLRKLVEEREIEIQDEAELVYTRTKCSSIEQGYKQETIPSAVLQLSGQQQEKFQIISIQDSNDVSNQNQSLVSSSDPTSPSNLDSEIGESSLTTERMEWAFLMASLFLEGVSAVLDQLGNQLVSTVLAFVALLLCAIDLVVSARREGLIKMERSCSPCFCCHSRNDSPTSELFMIVQCFGFTSAVWQCLFSTLQYIYSLRHLENPIKMTLLPFIFLFCVLISKFIRRKLEDMNCQDLTVAKIETPVDISTHRPSSTNKGETGQTSRIMETILDITHQDAFADSTDFGSGDYGCLHYRRRCKIRAPCCNEIFDCMLCHNETKNSVGINPCDQHHIPSHKVIKIICSLCHAEQDVQQICVNCGVFMGKYFCAKCIFFDDDVSKNQYHCDECGICRDGGRENFSHCRKCGSCYPKSMEDAHEAMHTD